MGQLKCRCLQAGRRIMGLGDDGILTTASRERNVLDKAAADAKAALATTLGTGPTSTMGVGALNPYCCVLFFLVVHGELTQLSLSFLSFPLCLHSLLRLL